MSAMQLGKLRQHQLLEILGYNSTRCGSVEKLRVKFDELRYRKIHDALVLKINFEKPIPFWYLFVQFGGCFVFWRSHRKGLKSRWCLV